jgi:ribonuclease BN (tRNA processing enzyme)
MIRVTFLGVGAALPSPGQTNCAYLLEADGVRLLFDCGPAILQQLAAVGRTPGDITHLYVSHAHGDHALGFPMFRLWWSLEGAASGRPAPVVVAGADTWNHLRMLWGHCYGEIPAFAFREIDLPASPHGFDLTPGIRLRTWPMRHSTLFPVLGARFEIGDRVIAFTADTARCDSVFDLARGADLLVADSRHAVTIPPARPDQSAYHCSAHDAGTYATLAGVKRLALVHIGAEYEGRHAGPVAEAQSAFGGPVSAPEAGDVIEIG